MGDEMRAARKARGGSGDERFDHVAVDVGEPAVDAVVADRKAFVVKTEMVQDEAAERFERVTATDDPGLGLGVYRCCWFLSGVSLECWSCGVLEVLFSAFSAGRRGPRRGRCP